MDEVPVVDLLGDPHVQVNTVDLALRTFGFFYVKNHGLDEEVQAQFEASRRFFDLSKDAKDSMPFDPLLDIGYVGPHGQNLDPNLLNDGTSEAPPTDTKEQFMQTNNSLPPAQIL